MALGQDRSLDDATGWVETATGSVTMGEVDLDREIHDTMIHVAEFPTSRFTLGAFDPGGPPLALGRPSPISARGTFTLMGLKIPLQVTGEIEPIIGKDGAPRLSVSVTARIRLMDPFNIAGPEGPAPANDTLVFYLNFVMKEA